jgi:hypothetical protein
MPTRPHIEKKPKDSPQAYDMSSTGLKQVIAHYTRSEIPEYVGNEFIEALGPIPSSKQLATLMTNRPSYHPLEREKPDHIRKHLMLRLKRFYEPLTEQNSIAQTLSEMVRSGYVNRNPSSPAFKQFLQLAYLKRQQLDIVEQVPDTDPMCDSYAIIGVSGVGKSRLTRRGLAQFPSLIWHPQLGMHQIPYIIVECPYNGTIRQLAMNFFNELDKIANTSYEIRFAKRKMTVEELIREINAAAHLFGIGLIVIDEIQHAKTASGTAGEQKFLNFLVRFVNTSVAPVVLIGTMSSLEMLQSDFRQARRTIGALLRNHQKDDEWDHFLKAMWKYQWTRIPTPLTEKLNEAMYERTQGVLDLAVKLYQYVQRRAIDCKAEEITADMIHIVANEELTRVEPMVEALASGNYAKLARYGDLTLPEVKAENFRNPIGSISGESLQKLLSVLKGPNDTHNQTQ